MNFEEKINQFLDDELSINQRELFIAEINSDFDKRKLFDDYKKLHRELKKMEITGLPEGFSEKVIKSIEFSKRFHKENTSFFKGMIYFFLIMILAVFYLAFQVSSDISINFSEYLKVFQYNSIKDIISNIFQSNYLLFLGSGATILLLITAYLISEEHKLLLKSLKNSNKLK